MVLRNRLARHQSRTLRRVDGAWVATLAPALRLRGNHHECQSRGALPPREDWPKSLSHVARMGETGASDCARGIVEPASLRARGLWRLPPEHGSGGSWRNLRWARADLRRSR